MPSSSICSAGTLATRWGRRTQPFSWTPVRGSARHTRVRYNVRLRVEKLHGRALVYWTRSGNQGDVVSRIKQGDYYYDGLGVARDLELAARIYGMASEMGGAAQADFNLGYLYEHGLGVPQVCLSWAVRTRTTPR